MTSFGVVVAAGQADGPRAHKRAREELAMLQREARPKQKPVKTL